MPPSLKVGGGWGGLEDQSVRTPEADGKLASSIPAELMAVTWDTSHVGKGRRAQEGRQAALEDLPVVRSPVLIALAVVRADLLQLPAGP